MKEFGIGIEAVMNDWVRRNPHVSKYLVHTYSLLKWSEGRLIINLTAMDDEYIDKFVRADFGKFCNNFLLAIQKPIGEMLFRNGIPTVVLDVEFKTDGMQMRKTVTINPILTLSDVNK